MAAGFGPGSWLLAHVLAGSAHGPGHAQADPGARPASAAHAGVAFGVLFADAAALGDDAEPGEPARAALRAAAMPDGTEPAVTALALRALLPPGGS